MRRGNAELLLAVVAILLVVLMLPQAPAGGATSHALPAQGAPAGNGASLAAARTLSHMPRPIGAPFLPAPAVGRAPSSSPSAPSSLSATSASPSGTPTGPCAPNSPSAIDWAQDVNVTFSLFDANRTAPAINPVSSYATALNINIWTGKANSIGGVSGQIPIEEAYITVWAVGWNNQSLNSTLPTAPAIFGMKVDPHNLDHASGQLNDFKFYPPGSTVYFNLSLVQNATDPANWTSQCPVGAFNAPWNPAVPAPAPEPTWVYHTSNGWPSSVFENDITITATPDVMNGVQPDPFQAVYFYLNSSKIGMPIGGPLGGARLYYTMENRTGLHPGGSDFCGDNNTFEVTCYGGITTGVGPWYEPGDIVHFYFEAFVSTQVGIYNKIFSRPYSFVYGNGGTWCQPDSGYQFYGWSGSALPPYHDPLQQNGNYSGSADPTTLTLNGPVTEIAVYTALGSAASIALRPAVANVLDPAMVDAPGEGIAVAAPSPSGLASPAAPNTVAVSFTEVGLPAGSTWSVLLGTQNLSSSTSTITFSVAPNANYAYTVTSPLSEFGQAFVRYVASPLAGTVAVGSSSLSEPVNFTTQVFVDIIQNPWNAGNVSTSPTAYGHERGWYDNNTQVSLTSIGFFGFDYFVTITAGHSVPYPMEYVVDSSTNNSLIPAFFGILNLSLGSNNQTLAIAYAYVFFNETYLGQALNGVLLMNEANSTTYYTGDGTQLADPSDIGPFPPGVNVTLYMVAYDELGCPLRSPTYHFHTAQGPPPVINSRTYFYVVVYDQGKNNYVPNVPVNISNNTWWDICYTNQFGFCYPNASFSSTPLFLSYGEYNVTVTYGGQTQSVTYQLTPTSNKTLTFIFNSAHQSPPIYSSAQQGFSANWPYFPLPLFLGMVMGGALGLPIVLIWYEQRRKAAAEEKRITL